MCCVWVNVGNPTRLRLVNINNIILMQQPKCYNCQGTGTIEVFDCGMPASECCGGCTTNYTCPDCGGTGVGEAFDSDEYVKNYFSKLIKTNKNKKNESNKS